MVFQQKKQNHFSAIIWLLNCDSPSLGMLLLYLQVKLLKILEMQQRGLVKRML